MTLFAISLCYNTPSEKSLEGIFYHNSLEEAINKFKKLKDRKNVTVAILSSVECGTITILDNFIRY